MAPRAVALIGVASGALYAAVYWAQRALWRNGLEVEAAGTAFRGDPASSGRLAFQLSVYVLATLALFALYGLVVWAARREGWSRSAVAIALAFPVLFNLGLLFGRPYFSIDLFSYVGHGAIGNLDGGNPYLDHARTLAPTPFGRELVDSWGWRPIHAESPYGPLWTNLEILVLRLTDDVWLALRLFKLVLVAASVASAWLIWRILGAVRPEAQLVGTLAYLWNPMIVVELAGEGHLDAVMVAFVLAALALAVAGRCALSSLALGLAVLTKYLPLILAPPLLVYTWRTSSTRRAFVGAAAAATAATALVAAALYWPLWEGGETFRGVREAGDPRTIASTAGVVFGVLSRLGSDALAADVTSLLLGGVFVGYLVIESVRVRDARSLLRACALIALAYTLVATPAYWPWYAALPVALLALTPSRLFLVLIVALSLGARLAAPLDVVHVNGFISWGAEVGAATLLGVWIPLLLLVAALARRRRLTAA